MTEVPQLRFPCGIPLGDRGNPCLSEFATYDGIVTHIERHHPGYLPPPPPDGCGDYQPPVPVTDDIFDATATPGVTELPAVQTSMDAAQFKEWLAADGELFMVVLTGQKTFILKVPALHHEFFVAMMQQIRFALGPEVQAVRMSVVSGPPPDVDTGTTQAANAPGWAQPDSGADHEPEQVDSRCKGCGVPVDADHLADCPTWAEARGDTPEDRAERAARIINTPLPRGDGPAFA